MRATRFSCGLARGGSVCLGVYTPREQNDWQTGVKTLPCPRFRLRAVINIYVDATFQVEGLPNMCKLAPAVCVVRRVSQ